MTETAVQGATPTESYGNFGLGQRRRDAWRPRGKRDNGVGLRRPADCSLLLLPEVGVGLHGTESVTLRGSEGRGTRAPSRRSARLVFSRCGLSEVRRSGDDAGGRASFAEPAGE